MSENNNRWLLGAALGVGALTAFTLLNKTRRRFDFAGKVVLITGGARGLGLVMAREFAAAGARLAICARDGAELARARVELQAAGAEVFDVICDVREQSQVNQMIEDVGTRFGQIDVLVNNAGVIQVGPLEVQTQEDFENAMAIHFWAPFYTMQAVLPQMKRRGEGRIVNIASIGAKVAVPHLAPYCASKFALYGLSQALRGELYKDNIFVTTVCPGLMRTGSHINAIFKGKKEIEFALFSLMDALPLTSISAERAARQILDACRDGDAELIITVQAKLAAKARALFPETIAQIMGIVNQLLPAAGGIGTRRALGRESTSFASPSILTALADKASVRNNELESGKFLA
ncbi:MAG TPA: SDR family oxidoreductase [Pyrinomonadaceae bacterium]|nr:SDR family oxidoreductase [Pyrinomonadaceae bacterium]